MRRLTYVLAFAVALGLLMGPASARTLRVRTDPNDTFQPPDIRKVWSDLARRDVYVRVGAWDRLRARASGFIVVLDTRGNRRDDRVVEVSGAGNQCLVWKADDDGTLGDFIGERPATRPDRRAIACRMPAGWFRITKPVRFIVKSGIAGDRHRDRAPNRLHYIGL